LTLRGALALLLALVACARDPGVEVVQSFHGYRWGTPVEAIPEVAGSEPVGEKDGLAIYSAEVPYLGREVLAGFYFHPRTGGLVEGYYVLPITLEECEREWTRHVLDLETTFPTLVKEERTAARPVADSARYVSDCEYFVFNGEREEWRATFVNPAEPGDRAGAWLGVVGRSLRLTVFFRGGAGRAWEERFRWPKIPLPGRARPPVAPPPATPPPGAEGLPVGRA
jgi:hypothetical protein